MAVAVDSWRRYYFIGTRVNKIPTVDFGKGSPSYGSIWTDGCTEGMYGIILSKSRL